jgi:hypothetical protein
MINIDAMTRLIITCIRAYQMMNWRLEKNSKINLNVLMQLSNAISKFIAV